MGLIGGDGEKSDKEKLRERAEVQDQFSDNKRLENALVQDRKKDTQETRNQLLDTREVKQQLKRSLMGVKPVEKPVKVLECGECGSQHQSQVDKCRNCGSTELVLKQSEVRTRTVWVSTSEKQLVNQEGFDLIWSEVQASINENVTGSFLPAQTIDRVVYATCGTIIIQLAVYNERYGVENPQDMVQIVDIVRKNVLATANKARGGRALKSQEKTVVEKVRKTLSSDDEDDNDEGSVGIFS